MSRQTAVLLMLVLFALACEGTIGDAGGVPREGEGEEEAATGAPRLARRLSGPQLQAAIVAATGFDYVGTADVVDPTARHGHIDDFEEAHLLEVYGMSLGEPDYNLTVRPSRRPSITFAKVAADAVRYACGKVATLEVVDGLGAEADRHLLFAVDASSSLPSDERAIRENIARLALFYWGQEQSPDDAETTALLNVFRVGHDAAVIEEPPEGEAPVSESRQRNEAAWRAVCIAMLQNPRFLTY